MMRRLVVSPWGRGLALAVGLALACTMQGFADPPSAQTPANPPSADKPSPTDKSTPDSKVATDKPAVTNPSTVHYGFRCSSGTGTFRARIVSSSGANQVIANFNDLAASDQQNIITFLRSL